MSEQQQTLQQAHWQFTAQRYAQLLWNKGMGVPPKVFEDANNKFCEHDYTKELAALIRGK